MTKIRLTKEFSFEAAHLLEGYDGACREIHGHSYRLFVTVRGVPVCDGRNPKLGMVMDFGQLKRIVGEEVVQRLDHAFVMRRTPAGEAFAEALGTRFERIVCRRARTCSPTSPPASRRGCPKEWNFMRSDSTRRPPPTPSGSPTTTTNGAGSRPRNLCPTGLRRYKSDSDEKTVSGRCLRTDL